MCEPTYIAAAALGMNVLQQQQQYQAQKEQAAAQELKNKEARKSAQRAYLADLANLDREKERELKKAALTKESEELELIKKQDKSLLESLEKGNSNVEALLRDVGYEYQSSFTALDQKVDDINIDTIFGRDDAYAAMRRSFNRVPDVFQPSRSGLLIGIGASAVDQYGNMVGGKYGKGKSSDLGDES